MYHKVVVVWIDWNAPNVQRFLIVTAWNRFIDSGIVNLFSMHQLEILIFWNVCFLDLKSSKIPKIRCLQCYQIDCTIHVSSLQWFYWFWLSIECKNIDYWNNSLSCYFGGWSFKLFFLYLLTKLIFLYLPRCRTRRQL